MKQSLLTFMTLTLLGLLPAIAQEHFKIGSVARTIEKTLIYDTENTWADETASDMHRGLEGKHPHIKQCESGDKVKILEESWPIYRVKFVTGKRTGQIWWIRAGKLTSN